MKPLSLASIQNDHPNKDDREIHNIQNEKFPDLPRTKSWDRHNHLYKYEGFWYSEPFLEAIMVAQQNFKARSTDILVASHLKTGTTWLKALSFSIATRSTFLDISSSPLLFKMPHDCFPFLEIDLAKGSSDHEPKFPLVATHLPYNSLPHSVVESGCKIVYIWREPKDVFVSLWYFIDKVQKSKNAEPPIPIEEAFELFCQGVSNYGPYWDHVLGYWKAKLQFPDKILFLKYEEMKKNTRLYVKQLAEFIGYPFSVEEEENGAVENIISMCSFEKLSNLEVNKSGKHRANTPLAVHNNVYFRKGKIGDWENELTPEMGARLDFISQQKFKGSGLLQQSTSPSIS